MNAEEPIAKVTVIVERGDERVVYETQGMEFLFCITEQRGLDISDLLDPTVRRDQGTPRELGWSIKPVRREDGAVYTIERGQR
jgi:hypothetical protein